MWETPHDGRGWEEACHDQTAHSAKHAAGCCGVRIGTGPKHGVRTGPDRNDQGGVSVRGRRVRRCSGAHRDRPDRDRAGGAGHRREQNGSSGPPCCQSRGDGAARWPVAAVRLQSDDGDLSPLVCRARLRPRQGLCADRGDGCIRHRIDRRAGESGTNRRRPRGVAEGEPGAGQLRLAGRRRARTFRRGDVCDGDEARVAARDLPRVGRSHDGSSRGSAADGCASSR